MTAPLPEPVDRIEVLVLTDNRTDSLSTVPANFVSEWQILKGAGMQQLSGSGQCCANRGLAPIVRARRGDRRQTMLFDAGPVGLAVEYDGSRCKQPLARSTRSPCRTAVATTQAACARRSGCAAGWTT